jgi:HlyD family secretion protein
MSQNVVTYTVEVLTDNKDGKLLPYMTANVLFESGRRSNVDLVPNAALRFKPQPQLVAPDIRDDYLAAQKKREIKTGQPIPTAVKDTQRGTVWVADGNFVRPIKLKLGLTDGTNTEVLAGGLEDGQQLVTGEQQKASGGSGTSNPFVSQPFGNKKQ